MNSIFKYLQNLFISDDLDKRYNRYSNLVKKCLEKNIYPHLLDNKYYIIKEKKNDPNNFIVFFNEDYYAEFKNEYINAINDIKNHMPLCHEQNVTSDLNIIYDFHSKVEELDNCIKSMFLLGNQSNVSFMKWGLTHRNLFNDKDVIKAKKIKCPIEINGGQLKSSKKKSIKSRKIKKSNKKSNKKKHK